MYHVNTEAEIGKGWVLNKRERKKAEKKSLDMERTSTISGNGSLVDHIPFMTMPATWLVITLFVTRYRTTDA